MPNMLLVTESMRQISNGYFYSHKYVKHIFALVDSMITCTRGMLSSFRCNMEELILFSTANFPISYILEREQSTLMSVLLLLCFFGGAAYGMMRRILL